MHAGCASKKEENELREKMRRVECSDSIGYVALLFLLLQRDAFFFDWMNST